MANPFPSFGANTGAAPASGGFGFGAPSPAQPASSSAAPAAPGFGGFGAAPAAAAAPATTGGFPSAPAPAPAATGGFGGFGAATAPAPADGAKAPAPAATGGFGGFGAATAPAPADGAKAPAPAATGGFGGFGAATAPAPADGAKAPAPAATGGFGGFGTATAPAPADGAKAPAPAAAAPTAAPAPPAAPGVSPSQEFAGKSLSTVLRMLDRDVSSDQRHFTELAQHVVARDRQIMLRGRELVDVQSSVKDALTAARSAEATLKECKQRQSALSDYLQALEDKVQPHYTRWEQQQKQQLDNRGCDQQRAIAYDNVMGLLEEVQAVEEKVGRAVRQHNRARTELLGLSEIEGAMRMVDGQLLALQCCSTLATALEVELDRLLGKGV